MNRYRWDFMVVALALAASLAYGRPAPAQAQSAALTTPPAVPKPFVIQDFWPGVGRYVSTVDHFNGLVAVARVTGMGTDNKGNTLPWECDLRVMQGVYVGRDGFSYRGTFVLT